MPVELREDRMTQKDSIILSSTSCLALSYKNSSIPCKCKHSFMLAKTGNSNYYMPIVIPLVAIVAYKKDIKISLL